MGTTKIVLVGLLVVSSASPVVAQDHVHEHASPYAGLEDREIKALSAEEVQGLLEGEGLGMALPAELNRYPGPRHVLDMADMLSLTPEQEHGVRAIFEEMQAQARELGATIVELERVLDRGFAEGTLTEARLEQALGDIASARGKLRTVHLRAHLRLHPILTDEQREHYQQARGYTE